MQYTHALCVKRGSIISKEKTYYCAYIISYVEKRKIQNIDKYVPYLDQKVKWETGISKGNWEGKIREEENQVRVMPFN